MKEATGELSMTAIVVVILGVIAVAAPIVIRTATNTMKARVACQSAYGCGACEGSTRVCRYVPDPEDENPAGELISGNEYSITCSCNNEDDFNN